MQKFTSNFFNPASNFLNIYTQNLNTLCQNLAFGFMQAVVDELINGTLPEKSPHDVVSSLSSFKQQINVEKFRSIDNTFINRILKNIWTILLTCSASQSSSIRVAAYSATSVFLLKLMPYYPSKMRTTFTNVAEQFSSDSQNSLLLIASFAFMSHFIAPMCLEDFLSATPIYHHFVSEQCVNSEHLSNIISNLSSNISIEWFKMLLLALLNSYNNKQGFQLMKGIAEIIKKEPNYLLNEILITSDKWSPPQISLISYVFTYLKHNDSTSALDLNSFDLYHTAIAAFQCLKKMGSITEIDESLSILSLRTKSFTTKVEKVDDNSKSIKITIVGYDDEIIFNDENAMRRSTFYLLPLPDDFLIVNDNDTTNIIQSKLTSLGNSLSKYTNIVDVEYVIDLLDKYCSTYEYNDIVSSSLKCLSRCINSLILNAKSRKLLNLLNRILFVKTVSWYHAYDILMVFKSLKNELIPYIFGNTGFHKILKQIITFCNHPNDDLSHSSFETISALTTKENFIEVTDYVAKDINFFDRISLQKHLLIISGLIAEHPKIDKSHLYWVFNSVIECFEFYTFDIDTTTSIFHFLSFFNYSTISIDVLQPILDVANIIYDSTIHIWVKNDKKTNNIIEDNLKNHFFDIISNQIIKKNIDIISKNSFDYRKQLIHLFSVMNFLFSLPLPYFRLADAGRIILHCFRFFPLECSAFLLKRISYLHEIDIINTINFCAPFLDAIPDTHVHIIWCKIAMKINLPQNPDIKTDLINKMLTTSLYIINNNYNSRYHINKSKQEESQKPNGYFNYYKGLFNLTPSDIVDIIAFLDSQNVDFPAIKEFIYCQEDETRLQVLTLIQKNRDLTQNHQDFITEMASQFILSSDPEVNISNFRNLLSSQKQMVINMIRTSKEKITYSFTKEVIDYAKETLNGWQLIDFYKKANLIKYRGNSNIKEEQEFKSEQNEYDAIEERAFNPIKQKLYESNFQEKFLNGFENDSLIGLKILFSLSKIGYYSDSLNDILFASDNFNICNIPLTPKTTPILVKFFADSYKENNFNDELSKNIETIFVTFNPLINYYLHPNYAFDSDSKLSKAMIIKLCKFITNYKIGILGLNTSIIKNLQNTNSINKITALLRLASLNFFYLNKEPNENKPIINFENIFETLKEKENYEVIPQRELLFFAMALKNLIHANIENYIPFIESICDLFVLSETKTLNPTNYFKSGQILQNDEFINDIFKQDRPSLIAQGIKVLQTCVSIDYVSLFTDNLYAYIKKINKLSSIYPISEIGSCLLVEIINRESCNDFRGQITERFFGKVLVPISKASFSYLFQVAIELIKTEDEKSSFLNKIVRSCDTLIEEPTNHIIFKLFVESLNARLKRVIDISVRKRIIENYIHKFTSQIFENFDSYYADKYLFECFYLLKDDFSFNEILQIFCKYFIVCGKRYFPVFVVIHKMIAFLLKLTSFSSDSGEQDSLKITMFKTDLLSTLSDHLKPIHLKSIKMILEGKVDPEVVKLTEGII